MFKRILRREFRNLYIFIFKLKKSKHNIFLKMYIGRFVIDPIIRKYFSHFY